MAKKVCACGGTQFDSSNDGSTVCVSCGNVIDSSNIVSEIQFSDSSGVMGTFVSKTGGSRSYRSLGRDSRELSLENARRRLHQIASQVNLKQHHIDMALRMYQLAIEHNFTKGRRTQNVAATCLYIICRRESTPHLLIDFSEAIQVNVFVLAQTFIAFSKMMCLQLPVVDPSLFIHRFANSLEFEEKTQEVASTALKLVARMKRDWMATGRRPSGICGASLFIAAKIHGFTRTVREIIQIVKIGESTLVRRLEEFKQTPASMMRINEFDAVDIEGECDPPSFTRNREKDAADIREEERKKLMKEQLFKDVDGVTVTTKEEVAATPTKKRKTKGEAVKQEKIEKIKDEQLEEAEAEINEILLDSKNVLTKEDIELIPSTLAYSLKSRLDFDTPLPPLTTKIVSYPKINDEVDPTVFEPTATLEDLSDDELNSYIESDKETINAKDVIWSEMNKEWIIKQAQKEQEAEEAKASGVPVKKRRTKKSPATTEESLQESIRNKAKQERIMNLFKNLIHPESHVKEELLSPGGANKSERGATTAAKRSRGIEEHDEDEEEEKPTTSISHSLLSQQKYDDDYYDDY